MWVEERGLGGSTGCPQAGCGVRKGRLPDIVRSGGLHSLFGNLVVVELKRDTFAGYADLQSIRYAAMVSTMTIEQFSTTTLTTTKEIREYRLQGNNCATQRRLGRTGRDHQLIEAGACWIDRYSMSIEEDPRNRDSRNLTLGELIRNSPANRKAALIPGHGAGRRPRPSMGRPCWVAKVR